MKEILSQGPLKRLRGLPAPFQKKNLFDSVCVSRNSLEKTEDCLSRPELEPPGTALRAISERPDGICRRTAQNAEMQSGQRIRWHPMASDGIRWHSMASSPFVSLCIALSLSRLPGVAFRMRHFVQALGKLPH